MLMKIEHAFIKTQLIQTFLIKIEYYSNEDHSQENSDFVKNQALF